MMIPTRDRNMSGKFTVTVLYNITRCNKSAFVGSSGVFIHVYCSRPKKALRTLALQMGSPCLALALKCLLEN